MTKYTSIFATDEHKKITTLEGMGLKKRARYYNYFTMGFFLNGVCIGHGSLCLCKEFPKSVETSSTKIFDKFRKKGHGVHLYLHLIKTAKRLGARRIYSDTSLNDLSEKMWSEKLPRYYRVLKVSVGKKSLCNCCKKEHRHNRRYYIDLGTK